MKITARWNCMFSAIHEFSYANLPY